jgi:type I restriction enzyme M protein
MIRTRIWNLLETTTARPFRRNTSGAPGRQTRKGKGREEGPFAWKVTADEVKTRGYNLDIKNPHTIADDHGEPEELLAKLTAAEAEVARLLDQLKAILAEALAR